MRGRDFLKLSAVGAFSLLGVSAFSLESELLVYAGSANLPPLEKIIELYGKKVKAIYGGSGYVLTQAIIAKKGDVYLPGSNDFMELAKEKGAVYEETEKILAYLIPVIVVRKDNPKKISKLEDLEKDGIRIAIANPNTVCVGLYAVELFEYNGLDVKKNVVTLTKSCSDTASIIEAGAVDAVIGWDVFDDWSPNLKVIFPKPEQIPRVAYIPIAVMKFTKNFEKSLSFLNFVYSNKRIYKEMGYLTEIEEVRKIAPKAKIGGKFELPEEWKSL